MGIVLEDQVKCIIADSIFGMPSIKPLGTFVPIDNVIVQVARQNSILGFIEERCLFTDLILGAFTRGDVASKAMR